VKRLLVLAYHAITPRWKNPLALHPARFEAQVRKLDALGYRGVTFTSATIAPPAEPAVVITFDDAFNSVAEFAAAILAERGWPATVFPVTTAVDAGEPMNWLATAPEERNDDLRPLSWDQLAELRDAGWEIGSHSRTHRLLLDLSDEELTRETEESRREIVQRLGSCTSFSYPWGVLDERVVAAARRAGYLAASGLAGRFHHHNPLAVPRFAISSTDHELRFRLKTSATLSMVRSTRVWDLVDTFRHSSSQV
jgi:peptidoglycan/xylan/chitin deacetylase (PgdA/CDA1 family)